MYNFSIRVLILLSILILSFSCSVEKEKTKEEQLPVRKTQPKKIENKIKETHKDQRKITEIKPKPKAIERKSKIEQGINELDLSTAGIIKQNLGTPTPSMKVDTIDKRLKEQWSRYETLDCTLSDYANIVEFSIAFDSVYEHSHKNTGLSDGKIFCLKNLFPANKSSITKIIYGRNEGGHTSDQMELITIDAAHQLIYHLPLSYFTGWDGYEIRVHSKINSNNLITRNISERYGWSNLHPDSLALQPRREIKQRFQLSEDGGIEGVGEEISEINLERFID